MKRLVLVALLVLANGCGDETTPVPRAAEPVDWSIFEPGWTELPAPPYAAACPASVWTGRELIYWGGDGSCQEGPVHDEGAAFDPIARAWRALPPAPIDGRSSPAAVWTGEELLIWGGWNGNERDDGAAYAPATNDWRMLSESPLGSHVPTASVWTEHEMLVWRGPDGAAYDPANDSWRVIAAAPYALERARAVWTGKEMIVYGMRPGEPSPDPARGLAYDPAGDRWREIAVFDLSPQSSMVVWTGREMIAWDYEFHAGAYDPSSDSWRALPDLPLEFYECYADGALAGEGFVLAWHCGQAAILELATETWRELPRPPTTVRGQAVAADGVVLFAGAWGENTLWAYRPGPLGVTGFVPGTERRGERDFLPLTFPDGRRIVLSYPLELALAGMAVEPTVSYRYREDPPPRFELEFVFGPAEARRNQVALRAGSWTVLAQLRDRDQAELIARSLRVRETIDGFPAVEALDPVALSDEPGEGGGPAVEISLPRDRWIHVHVEPNCLAEPQVGSGSGGWCLSDYAVVVYGDRPFIEAVLDGLRLEKP